MPRAKGVLPLTDAVNKAILTANAAIKKVSADFNAQRASLEKQLNALDLKHGEAINGVIKKACTQHGAPFVAVQHRVLSASADGRKALSPLQVAAIRQALASGVPGAVLARQYEVSSMCISRIRNGKMYKT